MPKISSTLKKIISDHPNLIFSQGDDFYWRPEDNTIYHPEITDEIGLCLLLHEVGHALLEHEQYSNDIELVDMERQAWQYATSNLAPNYRLDENLINDLAEESLDSYRDWLHKRSTCPNCSAVGIGSAKNQYRCLVCGQIWHVNEARTCELRRYKQ